MRAEKTSLMEEYKGWVKDESFLILADYRGLTVAKMHDLRQRLHGAQASLHVIQNRLFRHAVQGSPCELFTPSLKGPSAVIAGRADVVQAARVLKAFIKENALPVIKAGALDGSLLTSKEIERLAELPAREVLLAQVVGTIAAPMTRLAGVLQQKVASLLYVLKAVEEKKAKS